MRTDCRHYDSRTYPSGEVVQKCRLDLAPDAPWRCPDDCPSFSKRLMDVGWQYGSFTKPKNPESARPDPEGDDVAALLDAAEDIVNSAAPEILSEMERKQNKKGLFRRKGKGKGQGKGKRRK